MDEFDKRLSDARPEYQPTHNFTEATMDKINEQPIHATARWMTWFPLAASGVAVVAIVAVVLPIHRPAAKNTTISQTPSRATVQGTTNNPAPAPTTGSVQTSDLEQDLSSIDGSLSQASSDQASADNGLNDSSQQIAVPTN